MKRPEKLPFRLKTVKIDGKRRTLPEPVIEVEKLVKKGLALQEKAKALTDALEAVKIRLTEIGAGYRKPGSTSVKLEGITGGAVVTFRESWEPAGDVEDLGQELGPMFERFFVRETKHKATKELSDFMDGHVDGQAIADPEAVRELLEKYLHRKVIKPNVRITPAS